MAPSARTSRLPHAPAAAWGTAGAVGQGRAVRARRAALRATHPGLLLGCLGLRPVRAAGRRGRPEACDEAPEPHPHKRWGKLVIRIRDGGQERCRTGQ